MIWRDLDHEVPSRAGATVGAEQPAAEPATKGGGKRTIATVPTTLAATLEMCRKNCKLRHYTSEVHAQ